MTEGQSVEDDAVEWAEMALPAGLEALRSVKQDVEKVRGLEPRYRVEKIKDLTGKHDECRYFVLDPQHDPMARAALLAYEREARRNGYSDLADDLGLWVHGINEAEYAASRLPSADQNGDNRG